jgi:predicted RNA polymerase sigma factor
MCAKVTKYAKQYDQAQKAYQTAIMNAMAQDSKNSVPDQPIADQWFNARLSGSTAAVPNPNGNVGFYIPGVDY